MLWLTKTLKNDLRDTNGIGEESLYPIVCLPPGEYLVSDPSQHSEKPRMMPKYHDSGTTANHDHQEREEDISTRWASQPRKIYSLLQHLPLRND